MMPDEGPGNGKANRCRKAVFICRNMVPSPSAQMTLSEPGFAIAGHHKQENTRGKVSYRSL